MQFAQHTNVEKPDNTKQPSPSPSPPSQHAHQPQQTNNHEHEHDSKAKSSSFLSKLAHSHDHSHGHHHQVGLTKEALNITYWGIGCNVFLVAGKFFAGIVCSPIMNSEARVSVSAGVRDRLQCVLGGWEVRRNSMFYFIMSSMNRVSVRV